MARKKCPACGKKIAQEATYCIYCRTWLERAVEHKRREAIVDEALETLMEEGYDSAMHVVQAEVAQADKFATRTINVPDEEKKEPASAAPLHTMVMDVPENTQPPERSPKLPKKEKNGTETHGKLWLFVSVAAFLVIGVVFVSLVIRAARMAQDPLLSDELVVTTTTRDAKHDAWLQTFIGEWVDEESRGKKNLQTLGGHGLYIHEIVGDVVIFDVYSYSYPQADNTAYLVKVHAKLFDDVLHFTFANDARGHSGEGFMRLCEAGVEMEILIDNVQTLAEDENSLAVNALFVRHELPQSNGVDLKDLKTLDDVKVVAGEQTEPVAVNKTKKISTHTFGALSVNVRADNTVYSMSLDYSKLEDKTQYCYDEIDGTMGYDVVKMYFGEAEHDYLEQPTDIRVLHYLLSKDASVTFTFDSESQLLLHIQMHV